MSSYNTNFSQPHNVIMSINNQKNFQTLTYLKTRVELYGYECTYIFMQNLLAQYLKVEVRGKKVIFLLKFQVHSTCDSIFCESEATAPPSQPRPFGFSHFKTFSHNNGNPLLHLNKTFPSSFLLTFPLTKHLPHFLFFSLQPK